MGFDNAIDRISETTHATQGKYAQTWELLRKLWLEHYEKIPEELIRQRTRLLMAVRFTECFQTLFWIEWLALHGAYNQAVRELRSLLEGVIQAYYVDRNYRDLDVTGKLAVLREMSIERVDYGQRLIEKARPPKMGEITRLYGDLSEAVHTSVDYLSRILEDSNSEERIIDLMTPKYEPELFRQCCDFSKQVMEHVISIDQSLIEALVKKEARE